MPTPSDGWRAEAAARIERHRKAEFSVSLRLPGGDPWRGGRLRLCLTRHAFPFGVAVSPRWLSDGGPDGERYRKYVLDHFSGLVASDCMKWYSVEREAGKRDWSEAETLFAFAREHDLPLRGHCLLWARTHWVQPWVRALPTDALRRVVESHVTEAAERGRGRVHCWDVINELLDGHFFTGRLGRDFPRWLFETVHAIDPEARLFLNEYTVLEDGYRHATYLRLIDEFRDAGLPLGGIGIQEHDAQNVLLPGDQRGRDFWKLGLDDNRLLVPGEVWQRLDAFAARGLPIHLTEVTSWSDDDERRAEALADFYRLAFSHPAVESIHLWGFWERAHFRRRAACLLDTDWNALAPSKALTRLLHKEWGTDVSGEPDADGVFCFRGFPGRYRLEIGGETRVLNLCAEKPKVKVTMA